MDRYSKYNGHTPRPWIFAYGNQNRNSLIQDILTRDGARIVGVSKWDGLEGERESEANARLVFDSPVLLAENIEQRAEIRDLVGLIITVEETIHNADTPDQADLMRCIFDKAYELRARMSLTDPE